MKRNKFFNILTLALFAALVVAAPLAAADCQKKGEAEKKMAGKGCGMEQGCMMLKQIPNLSDEQKGKLEKMHGEMQKAMTEAKASMKKLAGEMQALMKDPVNLKKAEAKIDEMAQFHAGMQKKHLAQYLAVRALLTDEQKAKLGDMGGCMMTGGCMMMGGQRMEGRDGACKGMKHEGCCKQGEKKTEAKAGCGMKHGQEKEKGECPMKATEEKK